MRREVSGSLVAEAAGLALYPPVSFRGDVLADEGAWHYAVARASASELVELLVALAPQLLLITQGAEQRMQFYKRFRPTEVDPEPLLIGDVSFEPMVKAALALVPPIVRYAVLREAAFVAVGRSSFAWTSSARFVDITGRERLQVIAMGPECDELILLHEIAHVFTSRIPHEHSQAVSAIGERDLAAAARAEGWAGRRYRHDYYGELQADALALAWAYGPVPSGVTS